MANWQYVQLIGLLMIINASLNKDDYFLCTLYNVIATILFIISVLIIFKSCR